MYSPQDITESTSLKNFKVKENYFIEMTNAQIKSDNSKKFYNKIQRCLPPPCDSLKGIKFSLIYTVSSVVYLPLHF